MKTDMKKDATRLTNKANQPVGMDVEKGQFILWQGTVGLTLSHLWRVEKLHTYRYFLTMPSDNVHENIFAVSF